MRLAGAGCLCTVHHVQVVLNALLFAKSHCSPLQEIQLTCLPHCDDPSPGSPEWNSLTSLLTALVGHAPVLRLVGSDLVLTLLSCTYLRLRELDLCSTHTTRALVRSFLQNNVKSLRSFKLHDISVKDWARRVFTYVLPRDVHSVAHLTPRDICDMIDLERENASNFDKFSCSRSFRDGWSLSFTHGHFDFIKVRKKKRERLYMTHSFLSYT